VPGVSRGSPGDLPMPLTSFVGRERELATTTRLVSTARLVTLTGSPGTGKTRLAIEVARRVRDQYADGVRLVSLASTVDAQMVAGAIASALGHPEPPSRRTATPLRERLHNKHLLLVLDNFEQVLPAAPLVTELLASCPALTVLATSRARLLVQGEHIFAVPPLALPASNPVASVEAIKQAEAVRLFVERARAARHDFALTAGNAPAVAEICSRLDGLPLAIELAAARIRLLPAAELLARLEHRLPLLTGGAVDLPARQRTLRNAIAWSDNLLSAHERVLFQRLAVFAGGWTLEAVERIAGGLEGLEALLDHSLVHQEEQQDVSPRFSMLESIREYAAEQLARSGEAGVVQRRHAGYYVAMAEEREAWPEWEAQDRRAPAEYGNLPAALRWFIVEYANLQAALRWCIASEQPELGLRLCLVLEEFWIRRGSMSEGRAYLQALLALPSGPSPTRARALITAAALARHQGDFAAAVFMLEQAVAVWRLLGDRYGLAVALSELALAEREQGGYARAISLLEESLALFRAVGDRHGVACSLDRLGTVAHAAGDYALAQARYEEALGAVREAGNEPLLAWLQQNLANLALDRGDRRAARSWLAAALALWKRLDERLGQINWLTAMACLAAAEGRPERAVRLAAAVRELNAAIGAPATPTYPRTYERRLTMARQALSERAAAAVWAEGQAMTLEQVLAYAEAPEPAPANAGASSRSARTNPDGLTSREQEITRLLGRGMSNQQIASSLVISERTVETHVGHILGKLDLHTRAQVAAWVHHHRRQAEPTRRG